MLKPLAALAAGLWLSVAQAAAPVVPLTPGLTVTTALLEPGRGDYESTKRLEARQGAGWRITYRAAFPPGRAAGGTERVDSLRLQSDADLQKATTYRQMFETGVEEDYPGQKPVPAGGERQHLPRRRRSGRGAGTGQPVDRRRSRIQGRIKKTEITDRAGDRQRPGAATARHCRPRRIHG